ncbi:MAG TPA: hypothetical protein VNH15_04690 [Elusimicrobiota bacterium]|nr:hypothetical protein [Elusimicrobiota bacterium]
MTLKALRKIAATLVVGCLFLLAVHDLAHAKEKHPAPCQVCVMVARTAAHAAKPAPHVVSHAFLVVLAVQPELKPSSRRLSRAASRDPPAA